MDRECRKNLINLQNIFPACKFHWKRSISQVKMDEESIANTFHGTDNIFLISLKFYFRLPVGGLMTKDIIYRLSVLCCELYEIQSNENFIIFHESESIKRSIVFLCSNQTGQKCVCVCVCTCNAIRMQYDAM